MAVEGHRGLFRGFSAAMYRAIPVNAGIFLAVEGTRNLISKVRSGRSAGRSQQACVPPAGRHSAALVHWLHELFFAAPALTLLPLPVPPPAVRGHPRQPAGRWRPGDRARDVSAVHWAWPVKDSGLVRTCISLNEACCSLAGGCPTPCCG